MGEPAAVDEDHHGTCARIARRREDRERLAVLRPSARGNGAVADAASGADRPAAARPAHSASRPACRSRPGPDRRSENGRGPPVHARRARRETRPRGRFAPPAIGRFRMVVVVFKMRSSIRERPPRRAAVYIGSTGCPSERLSSQLLESSGHGLALPVPKLRHPGTVARDHRSLGLGVGPRCAGGGDGSGARGPHAGGLGTPSPRCPRAGPGAAAHASRRGGSRCAHPSGSGGSTTRPDFASRRRPLPIRP